MVLFLQLLAQHVFLVQVPCLLALYLRHHLQYTDRFSLSTNTCTCCTHAPFFLDPLIPHLVLRSFLFVHVCSLLFCLFHVWMCFSADRRSANASETGLNTPTVSSWNLGATLVIFVRINGISQVMEVSEHLFSAYQPCFSRDRVRL